MNLTNILFDKVRPCSDLTEQVFSRVYNSGGGGGLPSEYREVLGFELNNNCYWVIEDFKLTGSDTIAFAFSVTDTCSVIGCFSGLRNNYSLSATTSSGNSLRYNNGSYNSTVNANERYDVAITPTGSVGMKTDSTWTQQDFTCTTDFCIGTIAVISSSTKLKGCLYGYIKVIDDDIGVRLFLVPCERISDGVLGYYDMVGEVFYLPTYYGGKPTEIL